MEMSLFMAGFSTVTRYEGGWGSSHCGSVSCAAAFMSVDYGFRFMLLF